MEVNKKTDFRIKFMLAEVHMSVRKSSNHLGRNASSNRAGGQGAAAYNFSDDFIEWEELGPWLKMLENSKALVCRK